MADRELRRAGNPLRIERTGPSVPGPLLDDAAVAAKLGGDVTPLWVRANVPGKFYISYKKPRWYEREVDEWIASRYRQSGQRSA